MRDDLHLSLACPQCGGPLELGDARRRSSGHVDTGVLYDDCVAFPIVSGIPFMKPDEASRAALEHLAQQNPAAALLTLLSEGVPAPEALDRVIAGETDLLESVSALFSPAEADHLLYRRSDPVHLAARHLVTALVADSADPAAPILDLGGGLGLLTRSLLRWSADVVLADVSFVTLWLARRFVVPDVVAVCCDGNRVLPFAPDSFHIAVSVDAVHYVWERQLLAGELRRVLSPGGTLVLGHLHNKLVDNPSAGMPLTPAGYRRLFGPDARLLDERDVLQAAISGTGIPLHDQDDSRLQCAAALALVKTQAPLPAELPPAAPVEGVSLEVNPLYRPVGDEVWALVEPSSFYAEEYLALAEYLPRRVHLPPGLLVAAARGVHDERVRDLRARCVLVEGFVSAAGGS